MEPLVSIIIPAMNAEKTIARALTSALNQSYQRIIVVVIDGSPNDLTENVVRTFQDDRVRYLRQHPETRRQAAARNQGISVFPSDLVTFLDADDRYEREKVAVQVRFLLDHPEHGATYCDPLYRHVDHPDIVLEGCWPRPSGVIIKELFGSYFININTLMCRRYLFDDGLAFEDKTRWWPEDYQLCVRMASRGCSFGYSGGNLVTVELREHVNIPFEQMYILKKNTADMLAEVAENIDDPECARIAAKSIVRLRRKYAVACLMAGEMELFNEAIKESLPRPLHRAICVAAALIPEPIMRRGVKAIWNMGRRRHYRRLSIAA
jgi:glycosyltransferase involved in cell wall biosynthesis